MVPRRAEAERAVLTETPERSEGVPRTSETLGHRGLAKEVEDPVRYGSVRKRLIAPDRRAPENQMRRTHARAEVMIGSGHAVTEEGEPLVGSATGSPIGSDAYGAGRGTSLNGAQQGLPTLAEGLERLRERSLPEEDAPAWKAYGRVPDLPTTETVSREATPPAGPLRAGRGAPKF